MTNHARNGATRERRVRDHMTAHGWRFVMRSAGSKGAADLAMVHPFDGLALVQVGTASKSLSPADRERFVDLADACSALALLAVCSPGKSPRFFAVTRGTASTWEEWDL